MENLYRDVLFLLAKKLDLSNLLNFSASSKKINEKISYIWKYKLEKEFPEELFLEFYLLNLPFKKKYILLYSLRDIKEKLKRNGTLYELYDLKEITCVGKNLIEIPSSIGNLFNLEILNFYNNKLTKIPSSIGNLPNLKVIILTYNYLTKLPISIGNLSKLEKLYACDNNLEEVSDTLGIFLI
jgi:hypothetical protein